jgi:hypothetical protein
MKTESYAIGDLVKKTKDCLARYPKWEGTEGTVFSVRMHLIQDASLSSTAREKFRARYTIQEKYPMFELTVNCEGTLHMVSQFDFNKD